MTTVPESTKTSAYTDKYDRVIFHPGVICSTCKIAKRARSKHCPICDQCTLLADHHCIWVNNCIGRGNYRYFYSFLLSNIALLSYGFVRLLSLQRKRQSKPLLVLSILCGCFAIIVIVFGYFQIVLIRSGMTSNEEDKWYFVQEMMRQGNLVISDNGNYYFRMPKEGYDRDSESRKESKTQADGILNQRATSHSFHDMPGNKGTTTAKATEKLHVGDGENFQFHTKKPTELLADGMWEFDGNYINPNELDGNVHAGAGLDAGRNVGIGGGWGAGLDREALPNNQRLLRGGGGGGAGLDLGENLGMGGGGGSGFTNISDDDQQEFSAGGGGGAGFGYGNAFGAGGGGGAGAHLRSDRHGGSESGFGGGAGGGLDISDNVGLGGGAGAGISLRSLKNGNHDIELGGGGGFGSHLKYTGIDANLDAGGGASAKYSSATGLPILQGNGSVDVHCSVLGKEIDYTKHKNLRGQENWVFYSTNPYDDKEYYLHNYRVVHDANDITNVYDNGSFWKNLNERIVL